MLFFALDRPRVLAHAAASVALIAFAHGAPQGSPPIPVEVSRVQKAEARQSLSLVGEVRAEQYARLGVSVPGKVIEVLVREGDSVPIGAVLARLDRTRLEAEWKLSNASVERADAEVRRLESKYTNAELDEARARVRIREAELFGAEREFRQASEQLARALVPRNIVEDFETQLAASDARLAEAQQALKVLEAGARLEEIQIARAIVSERRAELDRAQFDLNQCEIKAPFPGIVVRRSIEVGEWAAIGREAFELYNPSELRIHARVPEEEIERVREGLVADVRVDAYVGTAVGHSAWRAVVERRVAWIDPSSRSFLVRFRLQEAEEPLQPRPMLLPGMFARLDLRVESIEDALSIPRDAIFFDDTPEAEPSGPRSSWVWIVKEDQTVERAAVRVLGLLPREPGVSLERASCVGELEAGVDVVVIGRERLKAGSRVQVLARS
jgi:RND family efflux transporter MFP subunit